MAKPQLPHKLPRRQRRPSVLLGLGWYATALHRGIARYARQANWILDIGMTRSSHPPVRWEGDGIICSLLMDDALDRLVENATMPTVQIGTVDHPRIPRVCSDNAAVGRMAAEYFLQRGFKNFAYYIRTGSLAELSRYEAFQHVVRDGGYKTHRVDWLAHCKKLPGGQAEHMRIDWLRNELARLPKPIAVFAEYDDIAVEILNACGVGDIPVPEQIAVLGVDDDSLRCDFAPVPLSSVDDDQELIGYEAAALLDRLMKGEPAPDAPVLIAPKGVTTRLSTDILAIEHPLVASALRTIWDHYTEAIGAKQVAATVPMSYRRLHDAFIQHVGHSISQEITRKRLEHARKLLEETDKKTIEVAWLSGFTDHDRMGKVFRRVLGVTPATYRKRFTSGKKSP